MCNCPTPSCRGSILSNETACLPSLLARAYDHLIDGDATVAGDNIANCVGDVLRAQTFNGAGAQLRRCPHGLADVRQKIRVNGTGQHDTDEHLPVYQLLSKGFRKGRAAELGKVVDTTTRASNLSGQRVNVHQVCNTTRRVCGSNKQMWKCGVRHVQHAAHVDVKHLLPLARQTVDRVPEMHYSGVIDHNVEASQLLNCLGYRGRCLLLLSQI